jgi:predicted nuclease of predicted toxin-antitoxin system
MKGLAGHSDEDVRSAAMREGRILLTQDMDFGDVRNASLNHPGIVLLRIHSPERNALFNRTLEVFDHEDVRDWAGCFVVVTDRKVRIRRPD